MRADAMLDDGDGGEGALSEAREAALKRVMDKPLWDERDLAIIFDVRVDTIRHMKARNEVPAVVQINNRTWRVHRDAFLEHFKQRGMPGASRGRPVGTPKPV